MRIVTSSIETWYQKVMQIPAGMRVVMPDTGALAMKSVVEDTAHGTFRMSGMGNYTRHYCGQEWGDLLAWRGCGIGDQLVFAGCLRELQNMRSHLNITLAADPAVYVALWKDAADLPFLVTTMPVPFDDWQTYDWHFVGENMVEADLEPDQGNIYRGHLNALGGADLAEERWQHARPLVPIGVRDMEEARTWCAASGHVAYKPLILWQLAASSAIRSLSPDATRKHVQALARAFPEATIALVSAASQRESYAPLPAAANIREAIGLRLRTVFALAALADVIVGPDSFLGHVAGALDIPCIGLWCPFRPADRVNTYPKHDPIEAEYECAPCRRHELMDKRGCPRREITGSAYCAGLASIETERIIEKVRRYV